MDYDRLDHLVKPNERSLPSAVYLFKRHPIRRLIILNGENLKLDGMRIVIPLILVGGYFINLIQRYTISYSFYCY